MLLGYLVMYYVVDFVSSLGYLEGLLAPDFPVLFVRVPVFMMGLAVHFLNCPNVTVDLATVDV